MAKHQLESLVCDNTLEIASKYKKVYGLLGELQPLDKLAIIEGSPRYSNDYNTLEIPVNVTSSKKDNKNKK